MTSPTPHEEITDKSHPFLGQSESHVGSFALKSITISKSVYHRVRVRVRVRVTVTVRVTVRVRVRVPHLHDEERLEDAGDHVPG